MPPTTFYPICPRWSWSWTGTETPQQNAQALFKEYTRDERRPAGPGGADRPGGAGAGVCAKRPAGLAAGPGHQGGQRHPGRAAGKRLSPLQGEAPPQKEKARRLPSQENTLRLRACASFAAGTTGKTISSPCAPPGKTICGSIPRRLPVPM